MSYVLLRFKTMAAQRRAWSIDRGCTSRTSLPLKIRERTSQKNQVDHMIEPLVYK